MTIGKAFGQIIGGVAQQEAGKYTRSVMQTNAANAEADTQSEIERLRTTARLAMGRQVNTPGASGLEFSGSALDALRESGIESQLEMMQTRRQGATAATGYRTQGKIAYAQGYNGMIQGFAGAAAAIGEDAKDYAAAGSGG